MLDGVLLESPKVIVHPLGDIARAMRASDPGYHGFGEAYFTSVHPSMIKGWKRHNRMFLNLVVIVGVVKFVLHDGRKESPSFGKTWSVVVSREENYRRLTVPPGIWVGFKGLSTEKSIILNMASIEHDPTEAENKELEGIPYDWNS